MLPVSEEAKPDVRGFLSMPSQEQRGLSGLKSAAEM